MRWTRALAFGGPVLEAVAVVQQLRWHAAHPDTEPFGSLLLAHSLIYVGALAGLLGAAAWLPDRAWRMPAALVAAAAFARVVAVAWDAYAHGAGLDAIPAHDLYSAGILLGAAGFAFAGVLSLARRWRP